MTDLSNTIKEAYEKSLRNTDMSYSVYTDGESGKPYIFEGVARGNNEPESAWTGKDKRICSFCAQAWKPEDGDQLFEKNLMEYTNMTEKEKAEVREALKGGELDRNGLIGKYPDAYEDYRERMIRDMVEAFNPEDYICEDNHKNGRPKRSDFEEDRMR